MEWPEDRLTRFEVARIISTRALQIALGAPVLVKSDKTDAIELAKEEFRKMRVPITIRRVLPNGEVKLVAIRKAVENWLKDHPGEP
ncbi:MAG: DNA-directed RNA polymerase subunit K [Candidatus Aenigmarchaeota archaeon]|nr:DNA-directed RNA polymerase subunit K [Candidatus Aenigmarchaeota archaeon]